MAGLVEWPVPLLGAHRRRLHGPAARGDAGLDADQPALFRAARRRTAAAGAVLRLRRQHRRPATAARPSSPATSACCGRGFADARLLLGPGPQGAAREPAGGAGRASPSTPSSAARASGCGGSSAWPARSRRWSAPTPRWRGRAALLCQGRPRHRHGRRVPRTAGRHGPLLRAARRRGPRRVADAIRDHYEPQGPGDAVPDRAGLGRGGAGRQAGQLVGFFAIGEKPTGSGDPYALRRAALGIIRIIRENGLRLQLRAADRDRCRDRSRDRPRSPTEVLAFLADRLRVQLRAEGARHDLLDAVLGTGLRRRSRPPARPHRGAGGLPRPPRTAPTCSPPTAAPPTSCASRRRRTARTTAPVDPALLAPAGGERRWPTALDRVEPAIDAALRATRISPPPWRRWPRCARRWMPSSTR